MSKMTDKEIPKGYCNRKLCPTALVIINRQQAQLEYLQGEREVLLEDIKASTNQVIEQQAEIERLKKGWKADVIKTENIKAEAIKEFAEMLKEFMHTKFKDLDAYEFEYVTENEINNLVKEMVGEGK